MNDEMIPPREMFLGPVPQELSTAGLQVEEPVNVERIELESYMRGPAANQGWETVRPGGEPIELLPDPDFDLALAVDGAASDVPAASARERQLETESLELAAELATLRAATAERVEALEARLVQLSVHLREREGDLQEQAAQIASLTVERDSLRARREHHEAPLQPAPVHGPTYDQRRVATLTARLDERERALQAALEDAARERAERNRLAEELAEREAHVARLLVELDRRGSWRPFDRDFGKALQRLFGTSRLAQATGASAPVEDSHHAGADGTATVVIDTPTRPAAHEAAQASGEPRANGERATLRRFLVALEPGSNEAHELAGARVYVGRAAEAGLRISDSTVSRVHAVLRLDGEQVSVEDAASTNGVFVNGVRVHAAVLNDFDTVTFGDVGYLFRLGPAVEEAALHGQ